MAKRATAAPGPKSKAGGAKLNRSETVTVRLDPRLNYLSELAARAHRRTKSSFIEWAVETALNAVTVPGTQSPNDWNIEASIDDLAFRLWDVDEADRLVALAFHAPILMTHEEQVLWKHIREYGYYWRGRWSSITDDDVETWVWEVREDHLIMDRLRKHFECFKIIARGDADYKDDHCPIPSYPRTRAAKASWSATPPVGGLVEGLDDDVPF